jgi:transcriptional regulator
MGDESELRAFVAVHHVAQLVTVGPDGAPDATLLPVLWEGDRLIAHFARANPHWRRIDAGSRGLAIVSGPDAYVSPSWYRAKSEHGKVVPTWNYSTVHLSGPVRVIDDTDWLRTLVTRLTERHESGRDDPWAVTDAPDDYIATMLRGIVGVEMVVTMAEGKAKLSQNRSDDDRAGVVAGLRSVGQPSADAIAAAMTAP